MGWVLIVLLILIGIILTVFGFNEDSLILEVLGIILLVVGILVGVISLLFRLGVLGGL